MSLSQNIVNHPAMHVINGALLEKVIIGNDLSGLSSLEKVQYVKSVCSTLGLNPVTKPIQLMKFQGKEIPYFTKDATEQLRKINKVSIMKIDTKMIDGGVYVVTAYANTPDGRQDSSTGVISTSGLKGDALANAMMKAETKAKRRVTLSVCGLGFIDESEVDSIPNAKKVDIVQSEPKPEPVLIDDNDKEKDDLLLTNFLLEIEQCISLQELQEKFTPAYRHFVGLKDKRVLNLIIEAKDKKKKEIEMAEEFNAEIDNETGEVL